MNPRLPVVPLLPRLLAWLLAWGVLAAGAGCRKSDPTESGERNPYMRRAKEKAQEKDLAGAIQLYKRALEDDPQLARAHLELGILHDETKDYIAAIYHYGAFLELRPTVEADLRKWVEDCIRHAKYSFVAEMPVNPGARQTIQELNLQVEDLKTRNQQLLSSLRQLQKQLGLPLTPTEAAVPAGNGPAPRPAAPRPDAPAAPVATPRPEPAAPAAPREYTVVAGDSFLRIAQKVYGNGDFKKIMDANGIDRTDRLKVGQVLKIP